MIQDIDVYRSAKLLMKQHGDQAMKEAMAQLERFRATADNEGQRLWNRIIDAIEWLEDKPQLIEGSFH